MWTTINKTIIPLSLTSELEREIEIEAPTGMEYDKNSKSVIVEFSDEGFECSEYEKYLRCANKKGKIIVRIEDHKGENNYEIHYGPGFYEEN